MAKITYLDKPGLQNVVREIKKRMSNIYTVKGKARFVDAAYLASADCPADLVTAVEAANTEEADSGFGLWQSVGGVWTKVDQFKAGFVYNIENAFTTSADFVEGAGKVVAAGTNIVVVNTGTENSPVLNFDVFSVSIGLDEYQSKQLLTPLSVFTNETPTVYTAASALPATEAVASATITDGMIAIIGGNSAETGDVYRASVTANANDATVNDITWVKLGNQSTVEGSLAVLGATSPNTPITAAEIEEMFNA